jgi:hypothetical protein
MVWTSLSDAAVRMGRTLTPGYGRLGHLLGRLDQAFRILRAELASAWSDTVVVERRSRPDLGENGTTRTDDGMKAAALHGLARRAEGVPRGPVSLPPTLLDAKAFSSSGGFKPLRGLYRRC